MRILILAKKFPYPLKEGEPIAISILCRELKRIGASLDLMVLNTSRHYVDPGQLPSEYNYFNRIWSVPCDTSITAAGALKSLVKGESYILSRFKSRKFSEKLAEVLQQNSYDIIQLETLFMAVYLDDIRTHSKSLICMRSHNVEHLIWERYAQTSKNLAKRWYLAYQARLLRKFETAMLPQYDLLLSISSNDLRIFSQMAPVKQALTAPVGIGLTRGLSGPTSAAEGTFKAGFIGAMDWRPNLDGVLWFLDEVWPKIRMSYSQVEFHIAGKSTPATLRERQGNGVFVHGEVEDSADFINQIAVLVVPLFAGSGIKIKVLEGMSLGKAVISTDIGFEGVGGEPGRHYLKAADAVEFKKALEFCLMQPSRVVEIGNNARSHTQENFDASIIARSVFDFFRKALEEKRKDA
jgi:glycosyltransferase involved in cell wall biosynthesis